jgi:DNA-binding MarR family transcriptional regulator
MTPTLQEEIRQSKPFASVEQEALVNIARTAAVLMHRMEQHFKPFGITSTQYNVLRIVQGAGVDGISQCDIASRLISETPDVPRLLKRTEEAGLIRRTVSPEDKRVLRVVLTLPGKRLLDKIATELDPARMGLFPKLTKAQLKTLNELLNAARETED